MKAEWKTALTCDYKTEYWVYADEHIVYADIYLIGDRYEVRTTKSDAVSRMFESFDEAKIFAEKESNKSTEQLWQETLNKRF